ncbi:MAG: UPF0489 family protein [Methanothrix sp.]|nr:UPF0489 family protein [Methanothrix sp.]
MNTVVVDSHNEILPFWVEEYLKAKHPLVVVRIDQHHDMNQGCPSLPATEGRQIFDYLAKIMPHIYEYAKEKLNEGNFTCPAFHYGIVGALYHFDPRVKEIDAYGRVSKGFITDAPKTTIVASFIVGRRLNQIIWDKASTKLRMRGGKVIPVPQNISIDSFKRDIAGCPLPVSIGFDLDGLYGNDDKGSVEEVVEKRLERVKDVLSYISSPVLACIARSQTPRAYVPPEVVDHLQQTVLQLIERKGFELCKMFPP